MVKAASPKKHLNHALQRTTQGSPSVYLLFCRRDSSSHSQWGSIGTSAGTRK
ncbi:hypothetical protein P7K49_003219, partial [Saguinus oedipus]